MIKFFILLLLLVGAINYGNSDHGPDTWPEEPGFMPEKPGYWPEKPVYGPEKPSYWPVKPKPEPEGSGYWPSGSGYWPEESGDGSGGQNLKIVALDKDTDLLVKLNYPGSSDDYEVIVKVIGRVVVLKVVCLTESPWAAYGY
ncbi:uncharacterized protein LOC133550747 isoform X2 [Nerophis ophidion]|uniref:uncharacterized protein LOC133550747 isoform X2 n=1 Tax=Nerophis ophidion TaxID=159077 RepID=UPI002ADF066C|nr:uncharacterized protein LOC133550747 isoform X2 [Nerophis ophidion]